MARKKDSGNKYDRIQSKSKGQYVQLPNELIESDAYRSLPSGARCLLIEFMRIVFPTGTVRSECPMTELQHW